MQSLLILIDRIERLGKGHHHLVIRFKARDRDSSPTASPQTYQS